MFTNKILPFFILLTLFVGISCTQNNPMEPEWIEEEIELEATLVSTTAGGKFPGMSLSSDTYKGQVRRCRIRTVYRPKRTLNIMTGFSVDVVQDPDIAVVKGFVAPTDEKSAATTFTNEVKWPYPLEAARTKGRRDQVTVFRTTDFRAEISPKATEFAFTLVFFDEKENTLIKENYVVDLSDKKPGRSRSLAEGVDPTTEGDDSTSPVKDEEAQEPTLPIKGR